METDVAAFAATYKQFMEVMIRDTSSADLTDIGTEVTGFLGVGLSEVDPLVEMFPAHQVVDLAVQIARPDLEGRLRLLRLYAGRLALSDAALREAAEETDGVTASFAKELIRRIVLRAAREDRTPIDTDLGAEVAAMRSDAELFTRVALGSGESTGIGTDQEDVYGGSDRWYQDE